MTKYVKPSIKKNPPNPIARKEEVQENPDMHIDQDFPGYPNGQAKKTIIAPKTKIQQQIAGISKNLIDPKTFNQKK